MRRPPPGLIHHCDRDGPYASDDYRQALTSYGMKPSMSRRADCWHNAVAESFFGTLQAELVDDERYPTRAIATESRRRLEHAPPRPIAATRRTRTSMGSAR
jgi:transposase InsO family protein